MIMASAPSTPKAGWEVKTLGEVCEFARGLTYKKTDEVEQSSNAVLRANNVSLETKSLNFDEIKFIREDFKIPESKKVRNGSLLICTASGSKKHLGKVALIDADYSYAFGGFMGLLTPHENISSKYFFYSLTGKEYENFIAELSDGANINNLKFSQLQEFRITVPPLPEQERIVGILDEAFGGIAAATAQAEKNLHNARELFQSVLQSTFSQKGDDWVTCPLADLLELITYGFTNPMPTTDTGPYMVTAKNIREGRINYETTRHTSKEAFDELLTKKSRPKIGDILLTKDGTLGRLAVVDRENICVNQSVAVLRPNEKVEPNFLSLLLSSPSYQTRMIEDAGGTTIKHIYITRVDKMEVAYPPAPNDRQAIVEKLDALSEETKALEAIYERKQSALAELKQSLLQKAFAGEL